MLGTMRKTNQNERDELFLNKGIEVMLPRSRRVQEEPPSWFDRTFRLLKREVRVRIDIHQDSKDGN